MHKKTLVAVATVLFATSSLYPMANVRQRWQRFKDRNLPAECFEPDIAKIREELQNISEEEQIKRFDELMESQTESQGKEVIALACSVGTKINKVNRKTFKWKYPLYRSLENRNMPLTRVLLGLGVDSTKIQAQTDDHPLCWARTPQQFDTIMEHMPAGIDSIQCGHFPKPIFHAIATYSGIDYGKEVNELFTHVLEKYKPNLDSIDENCNTALHWLAKSRESFSKSNQNKEFYRRWKMLIDKGASPEAKDKSRLTPDYYRMHLEKNL